MIDDNETYLHIFPYVHQMTQSAKVSATLIAISLTDLDSSQDREEAMTWLEHKGEAAASFQSCCQRLANLNGFLRSHGVDLEPEAKDVNLPSIDNDGARSNADTLPADAVDAELWERVVLTCASDEFTDEKRQQFAKSLVDIVDRQVQACYGHLHNMLMAHASREQLEGNVEKIEKQIAEHRSTAWLEDNDHEPHGLIFSSDTHGR